MNILTPAVALMNRLKYPRKFALITLLFLAPLAWVAKEFVGSVNSGIEVAQKEIDGDAYLRPLRALMEHVPQVRRLSVRVARGDSAAREELQTLHAQIGQDFITLSKVEARLGAGLETHAQYEALVKSWEVVRSDETYVDVIAKIRALISRVGDTSTLILDPDLDSYYSMDWVLLKGPNTADLLGQALLFGEDLAEKPAIK